MTSRVSWSVEGIDPSVRDRAEAAARRAGMSLGDWMKAAIDTSGAGAPRYDTPFDTRHDAQNVAEIHSRLDAITRQVESLAGPRTPPRGDPALARQLNEAISRLDARLSQISNSSPPPQQQPAPPLYTAPAPAMGTPLPPVDFSIAEIVARQGELNGAAAHRQSERTTHAPPTAPAWPDFSHLEQQLLGITSQIETLRRPDGLEQSIAAFRTELSDIRRAITEAMPRRAIESLEGEIRSLGRRIDETHQRGVDGSALAGIERALADIHGELRSLTPAEQLAGFDEALRSLGSKIDTIVRTSQNPGTLSQLDEAISALKTIVANVASNEALSQLADHLRTLSQKVDHLTQASPSGDILSALEQRIAVLTSALEQRERPVADASYFDNAVRTISDRLDHLQVGSDSAASLTHVEQRVTHLLERLEASGGKSANLGRVEEGLSEVLQLLKQQHGDSSNAPAQRAAPFDQNFIDAIKRELSDMRYSQAETDRHTQDSLEVVHSTLGHVVDRLAFIEGDLREARNSAPRAPSAPQPAMRAAVPAAKTDSIPPQIRPELSNPALAQIQAHIQAQAKAPAQTQGQTQTAPRPASASEPAPAAARQPAQRDSAPRHGGGEAPATQAAMPPAAAGKRQSLREPIDPDLPPDHPLEPGSRSPSARNTLSPTERIAASEDALQHVATSPSEPVSSSNFIQAARRAAQAAQTAQSAAAIPAAPKANRVSVLNDAARAAAKTQSSASSPVGAKIRAVLVGVSVVVIVLGTVKMAMNLLNSGDPTKAVPTAETSASPQLTAPPSIPSKPALPEDLAPEAPSMISPTPIGKQSLNAPPSRPWPTRTDNAPAPYAMPPASAGDVTGSVTSMATYATAPSAAPALVSGAADFAAANPLPDAIGNAALRNAARKGDAGAAYEIGRRYAEGQGVPANFPEAAKWYMRAAQGNIVPAMFRLGTLYEKGLGTKKDIEAASRYYRQASERGNAKAMHNLAVLEADGGGKPDYKSAAEWFRKAAERGVADSQFNLGILYARGIGVEQNLAESYKWFSLAAAQGDTDSERKRDDIAKRLDAQSLTAAKLAVQTFAPQQQPADAVNVAAPAGGWDAAPPQAATKGAHGAKTAQSAAQNTAKRKTAAIH